MTGRLFLVRHPPVAQRWRGRCYGFLDVGLSRHGQQVIKDLVPGLVDRRPNVVVHSGLRRARLLAERVANHAGCRVMEDRRWQERCFGSWEGQSWNDIWRNSPTDLDRLATEPKSFRPGGGETTAELASRVLDACAAVPSDECVIVVTHGGPIAVLLALAKGGLEQAGNQIPHQGEVIGFRQDQLIALSGHKPRMSDSSNE